MKINKKLKGILSATMLLSFIGTIICLDYNPKASIIWWCFILIFAVSTFIFMPSVKNRNFVRAASILSFIGAIFFLIPSKVSHGSIEQSLAFMVFLDIIFLASTLTLILFKQKTIPQFFINWDLAGTFIRPNKEVLDSLAPADVAHLSEYERKFLDMYHDGWRIYQFRKPEGDSQEGICRFLVDELWGSERRTDYIDMAEVCAAKPGPGD